MRVTSVAVPKVWSVFLLGAVSLSPFYFWKSGLPQASHILAALALLLRLLLKPKSYWIRGWGAGVAFVVYSAVVAVIVYARHLDRTTLVGPLYYCFDFVVFVLVVTICSEAGTSFLKSVFWIHACLLVGISSIGAMGIGRALGQARAMGTFNDPNQMANWLICSVCILTAAGRSLYGSYLPGLTAWGVAMLGITFSASRSGALGLLSMTVAFLPEVAQRLNRLLTGRARLRLLWILVAGSLLVAAAVLILEQGPDAVSEVGSRLMRQVDLLVSRFDEIRQGRAYATFAGRGYDRLWIFPQYLVFGAGEGATQRFAARVWFLDEIHSSWAGLLFCYGLVGTIFFCGFAYSCLRTVRDLSCKLILLGPFVYGLTTYNLRNWCLWIALAIVLGSQLVEGQRNTEWVPVTADA